MATVEKKSSRAGELIERCSDSHAEIAEQLNVDKSLVTRWRSGERKPTVAQLAKLEALYGAEPPLPSYPEDDDDVIDAEPDGDACPDEGNNARLLRYIRNGIRELENDHQLSGVKKAEALKKLVDAQVALDKSTGANALTMSRIAQHPEFKRVVRLITEALAPHPDVLGKVLDVLRANP